MSGDAAAALAGLDREIEGCRRCDLYRTATRAVPGEGPADSDIMLVGEAPGFNEDKQGRPFVGAAGKFLEELLAVAGLTREQVFITNVVKHRPPNNRDPSPDELTACRPWLDRQMEIINPRLIVTLGRFSLGTFLPGSMISKVHGQLREKDGRYYFPMYHPAAALHQQALRATLLSDMERLATFLKSPAWQEGKKATPASPDEDPPEQLSLF
ncbi:MAG TPA: uracil-DNA glycosylase [Chloroflexota bacterium]|nr:uracil-DNA glycosylase [Chloroflexota bacterium]